MRSTTDLEAALGLLADTAVEHHCSGAGEFDSARWPQKAVRRGRRHVRASLSAAAVVAGIALGTAALVHGDGTPLVAGGSAAGFPTSIPFRIGAAAKVTLVGVDVSSSTDLETYVYGQGRSIVIRSVSSPSAIADRPGRTRIHGQPGFVGCLVKSTRNDAQCPVLELTWRTNSRSWMTMNVARIHGRSPSITTAASRENERAQLLRLARNLDFTRSTPLLSPIAIAGGMRLSSYQILSNNDEMRGEPSTSPSSWTASFTFASQPGLITIGASNSALPSAHGKGRRAVTAGSRRGVWESSTHSLWLAEGSAVLLVAADHSSTLKTFRQVAAFADRIEVASDPDDSKTWFRLSRAL